jgi:hypothetical protein
MIYWDSQSVVQFVNSGKIAEREKNWDVKFPVWKISFDSSNGKKK